jgi:hypothetical protein
MCSLNKNKRRRVSIAFWSICSWRWERERGRMLRSFFYPTIRVGNFVNVQLRIIILDKVPNIILTNRVTQMNWHRQLLLDRFALIWFSPIGISYSIFNNSEETMIHLKHMCTWAAFQSYALSSCISSASLTIENSTELIRISTTYTSILTQC